MVTTLTRQEFSENTDRATEAAQHGPVFIVDGGAAAHVLLSIGDYQRLAVRRSSIVEQLSMPPGSEDAELDVPSRPDPARAADLT